MTARRTIGVLTFHRCINQGSYWQARCLVEGLRSRGHDVTILDHDARRVTVAEWKCALRPTLPTEGPKSDRPLYRKKLLKFVDAVSTLPLSPKFDLHDPAALAAYDIVVVGSDEVWNLCHPWYGGCPLFFGDGLSSDRLVSYAASFGNYDATAGLAAHWAQRLGRFAAISVRDENSRDIVLAATGRRPEMVLDPCLQFTPAWNEEWAGPDEPFVAVYGHNFSPTFGREVRRWAAARGYPLVSISYRNDWADAQWIDAGPHDFAQAISRAAAVATNFYHGCVFALSNSKPFVCEISPYRRNKVRCLMSAVGGERHLVSDHTDSSVYELCLDEQLGSGVAEAIDVLRAQSAAYLDEALV